MSVTDNDFTVLDIPITSCSSDGLYEGTLKVTDNAGNFQTDTFEFEWDTGNPAADAGSDLTGSDAPNSTHGTGFDRTGTGTDSGSGINPAGYSWTIDGPGSNDFSGISDAVLDVDNGDANLLNNGTADGIYTATLTVTDYVGNTDTDSFDFLWDTKDPEISTISDIADQIVGFSFDPSSYLNDPDCSPASAGTAGSGVDESLNKWEVSGAGYSGTVYGSDLTVNYGGSPLIILAIDGTADDDYTVILTVYDYAGNESATKQFSFGWNPGGTKAITFSDNLNIIGGSGSSGSSSSAVSGLVSAADAGISRISTDSTAQGSVTTGLSKATQPAAASGAIRRVSYSGNRYSLPSSLNTAAASNAATVPAASEAAADEQQSLTAETDTAENEAAEINLSPADSPYTSVIKSAAGSAASGISRTAELGSVNTGAETGEDRIPLIPAALILLAALSASVIIFRRRINR